MHFRGQRLEGHKMKSSHFASLQFPQEQQKLLPGIDLCCGLKNRFESRERNSAESRILSHLYSKTFSPPFLATPFFCPKIFLIITTKTETRMFLDDKTECAKKTWLLALIWAALNEVK